jgi:hypothetical protein
MTVNYNPTMQQPRTTHSSRIIHMGMMRANRQAFIRLNYVALAPANPAWSRDPGSE